MSDWARCVVVAAYLSIAGACAGSSHPVTGSVSGFIPVDDSAAFAARPYLQLGTAPSPGTLTLLWHAPPGVHWQVEVGRGGRWTRGPALTARPVAVTGVVPHTIYRAELTDLTPGTPFVYRVLRDGTPVFAAAAAAPKATEMPYRAVVFGDGGIGSPAQARVAYQTYRQRADLVAIAGDIVYGSGRMSEYHERFFPYYNAATPDSLAGAPLMRSTLFVAAAGNHDLLRGVPIAHMPDAFGYFAYWAFPHNGPLMTIGAPYAPTVVGNDDSVLRALLAALGDGYPRTANYSFDYGDSHWIVLDTNPYVDWTAPELRAWLERDLQAAQARRWRFVLFHAPGIHSTTINDADRQTQMRLVSDLFERYDVAVVFGGHYHNYQRSRPVRFALDSAAWRAQPPRSAVQGEWGQDGSTVVPGRFTIDSVFDGMTYTRPEGVIYLVTGAGGAELYEPEKTRRPERWHPLTAQFIADVHSFTVLDVKRDTLLLRQLSDRGVELDRIIVTKSATQGTRTPP